MYRMRSIISSSFRRPLQKCIGRNKTPLEIAISSSKSDRPRDWSVWKSFGCTIRSFEAGPCSPPHSSMTTETMCLVEGLAMIRIPAKLLRSNPAIAGYHTQEHHRRCHMSGHCLSSQPRVAVLPRCLLISSTKAQLMSEDRPDVPLHLPDPTRQGVLQEWPPHPRRVSRQCKHQSMPLRHPWQIPLLNRSAARRPGSPDRTLVRCT